MKMYDHFEEGWKYQITKVVQTAAYRPGGEYYKIEGTVDGTGYGELHKW